jgi:hypothetical protein
MLRPYRQFSLMVVAQRDVTTVHENNPRVVTFESPKEKE